MCGITSSSKGGKKPLNQSARETLILNGRLLFLQFCPASSVLDQIPVNGGDEMRYSHFCSSFLSTFVSWVTIALKSLFNVFFLFFLFKAIFLHALKSDLLQTRLNGRFYKMYLPLMFRSAHLGNWESTMRLGRQKRG